MFSPLIYKEFIQSLEIEKNILKEKIEKEREEIG